MSILVSVGFYLHFFIEGRLQICSGLIGETKRYEQNVRQFFAQIFGLVGFFFRLFAVSSGDDSGHFANFFRQHCHIRQLIEVTDANGFYPFINLILECRDFHYWYAPKVAG